jgi:DNA-binding transcriptional ArsR family regulator
MLPDDEFEREHESYGVLHISRGHSTGAVRLFGSPLATHYTTIRLSISKGKWIHGLNQDRFFGMSKDHIEVEMSAAQFADAITSLNIGSGTPCTVRYIAGKRIPDPPNHLTEAEYIRENFEGTLDRYKAHAREARKRIEGLVGKLGAKAKDEIRIALDVMEQQLASNVPFVVKQFQEATTRITTSAKAEVEAFVTHAVRAAGLAAIAEGRLPSLLPAAKPDDPRCGSQGVDDDGHCVRCGLLPVEDEGSNCPEGFLK